MRCLGIAQSQEDWYLRYLARSRSTHQPAVMMRSFGYMYKMRSFGYKPVGGGEGRGIGDYWSCCVVFHHINKPPRGKGRNLSAVHFTFHSRSTFYLSHILGCCFFSSNRSKAKSKHKHRSKSCYNVYMPSYVHQSQTQGIYTYITRCVTKRKTPTK